MNRKVFKFGIMLFVLVLCSACANNKVQIEEDKAKEECTYCAMDPNDPCYVPIEKECNYCTMNPEDPCYVEPK